MPLIPSNAGLSEAYRSSNVRFTSGSTKTEEIKQDIPPTLRAPPSSRHALPHHAGDAAAAGTRLSALHALMDTGALGLTSKNKEIRTSLPTALRLFSLALSSGVKTNLLIPHLQIPLPTSALLRIRTTPPCVVHALAFLLSAAAKRDAAGRQPKKGVFARAGLEFAVLTDVGKGRWKDDETLVRIKADLYYELVSIEPNAPHSPPS
ncbi:hypothetical protein DXG01_003537 [Tephrocybe rancida]|nr:hypothetical protein DXG01_003537 [Tephrocybe rancida]